MRRKAWGGRFVRAIGAGSLVLLLLTWTGALPSATQKDTAKLYNELCACCHAVHGDAKTAVGEATGARPFASAEVLKETDEEFIEILTKGKKEMPGYEKKLTKTQIEDLSAYCRALGKKK